MVETMPRELPESDVFVLLSKRRRRLTLQVLQESGVPITIAELAKQVAERERGSCTADDLRAIHIALYHNHLPRLEDADVVVYDQERGEVTPGLNFDTLVRVLERAIEDETSWSDE